MVSVCSTVAECVLRHHQCRSMTNRKGGKEKQKKRKKERERRASEVPGGATHVGRRIPSADDAQLVSLSSDNVISRQLLNVLDTLHLHTSSHITASSRITAHHHALPHCHSHCTHCTLIDAHIQKHTGYLELPLNYIEPTSS